jgi:cell division protein FtsB
MTQSAGQPTILGALLGWMTFPSSHGVALRIETARSIEQIEAKEVELHVVTLNTRQLRALAHDLQQIANRQEHIEVRSEKRRKWFRRREG